MQVCALLKYILFYPFKNVAPQCWSCAQLSYLCQNSSRCAIHNYTYIAQSSNSSQVSVLRRSAPCCGATTAMCRDVFSSSYRVITKFMFPETQPVAAQLTNLRNVKTLDIFRYTISKTMRCGTTEPVARFTITTTLLNRAICRNFMCCAASYHAAAELMQCTSTF